MKPDFVLSASFRSPVVVVGPRAINPDSFPCAETSAADTSNSRATAPHERTRFMCTSKKCQSSIRGGGRDRTHDGGKNEAPSRKSTQLDHVRNAPGSAGTRHKVCAHHALRNRE